MKKLCSAIIILVLTSLPLAAVEVSPQLPSFEDRGTEYFGIYLDGDKIGHSTIHEFIGEFEGRQALIMESSLDVTFPWGPQTEHLVSEGREVVDMELNLIYLFEDFSSSVRGKKTKEGRIVDDAFEIRTRGPNNSETVRSFDAENLTSLGALVHTVRRNGWQIGGRVPIRFMDLDMYEDNDKIENLTIKVEDKRYFEQIEGEIWYIKVPTTGSSLPFNFKVWSTGDGEVFRQVFDYKTEFTSPVGPWQMTFIKETEAKALGK
jgi:hypothetical protein